MALNSDNLKKQANDLWKQAVDQLDEAKQALLKQRGRFDADLDRLVGERDRLLQKLGEQTDRLAKQGSIQVPKFLQETADSLNEVIHRITKSPRPAPKSAGGKKRRTRRRVKKAAAQ